MKLILFNFKSQASSPASNQHSPTSLIKKQPFNYPSQTQQMSSTPPPKLTQYSSQPPTQTIYPNTQSPLVNNNNGPPRQYTPSAPFASSPLVNNNSGGLPPIPPATTQQGTPNDSIDPSRRSSYGMGGNKDLFSSSRQASMTTPGMSHHEIINANPNAKDTHV